MPKKRKTYRGKELDRVIRDECTRELAATSPAFRGLDSEALEGLRERVRAIITSDENTKTLRAYGYQAEALALLAKASQLDGRPFGGELAYLDDLLSVDDRYPDHPLFDFVVPKLNDPRDDPYTWLVIWYRGPCEFWAEEPTSRMLTLLSLFSGSRPPALADDGEYTFKEVLGMERKRVLAAIERVNAARSTADARSRRERKKRRLRFLETLARWGVKKGIFEVLGFDATRIDAQTKAEKRAALRRGSRLFTDRLKPKPDGGGTGGRCS